LKLLKTFFVREGVSLSKGDTLTLSFWIGSE